MKKVKEVMKRNIFEGLLLIAVLGTMACGNSTEQTESSGIENAIASWQEQYDLGMRYLEEGDYEQAIVAFTEVIELDPKTIKAYEGLAQAYIKAENYEKAQEVLQNGLSTYIGLMENEKTDELKMVYEELLKMQGEISLITEAKENYGALLEQVVDEIKSQKPTTSHYFTDDFCDFVKNLKNPLVWQWEDKNYLGLYVGTDEEVYVYFGEMDNGMRSGIGSWYGEYTSEEYSEIGTWLFYGNWSEDYPNGLGTYANSYLNDEGYNEIDEIQGDYQDGYENGTMTRNENDNFYNDSFAYDATHGVPHTLYINDDEIVIAEGIRGEENEERTFQVIYDGKTIWGIHGAMKN